MTDGRHAEVRRLFLGACRLEGTERSRWLDEQCAADGDLRAEDEALLAADEDDSGPLARPAEGAEVLAHALADDDLAAPEALGSTVAPEIPGYRVVGLLGRGGMGVVHEVLHLDSGRRAALKVLHPALHSGEFLRRFRRETRVLAQLQHPGIAQVLDSGTSRGSGVAQPYLVLELVSGEPIDSYVRTHGLDVAARLELVARVCDAVHYAHEKGVVHRDLKPANILVGGDAPGASRPGVTGRTPLPQPKVLDFGVARATDADLATVTLHTAEGQLVGTVPYMSPEQAAGDPAAIDRRSDVYSIGVIAFELLAGCLPYGVRGKLVHEAVRVIREDEPSSLGSLDSSLRGDVEAIVAKALEKEPERRYPTAAALAADLRRHNDHLPITARPPSTLYQLRKFARRNKGLVGGALATLVVALVGATVAILYALEATRRADQLSRVSDYQAKQLGDIDAVALGEFLHDSTSRAAVEALEAIDRADLAPELDAALARVNFTEIALRTLDHDIFGRAIAAARQEFLDQPVVEANVLQSLALTMQSLGLLDSAEAPQRRAYELRRSHLGEDHPDTLTSLVQLGWLYTVQRRLDEAVPLLRAASEGRRKVLPENHPDTLRSLEYLRHTLDLAGRSEESGPLAAEVVALRRATLGPDHPLVLGDQAHEHRAAGRHAEAARCIRRYMERTRELNGDKSITTLVALRNAAPFLCGIGEHAEAIEVLRESVEGTRRTVGERNSFTLDAEGLLAACLAHDGQIDEAEQLLRHVLELRQDLPAGHPDLGQTQQQLEGVLALRRSLAGDVTSAPRATSPSSTGRGD